MRKENNMTKLFPDQINEYENKQFIEYEYIRNSYEKYGFVYLMIANSNICKIGITQNLSQRFFQINQQLITSKIIYIYASPLCMNKFEIETNFKNNFACYNLKGSESKREWFDKKYLQKYLNYLNECEFDKNFISKNELMIKNKERDKKAQELCEALYSLKEIENSDSYMNISLEFLNKTKEQIIDIKNNQDEFIDCVLPPDLTDSISYVCEYYGISQKILLRKSLIYFLRYFDKEIETLPDDANRIRLPKPNLSEREHKRNIFDELAEKLEKEN